MEDIKIFLNSRLAYAEKYKGDYNLVCAFEQQAFGAIDFYTQLAYSTENMKLWDALQGIWDEYKAKFDALKH